MMAQAQLNLIKKSKSKKNADDSVSEFGDHDSTFNRDSWTNQALSNKEHSSKKKISHGKSHHNSQF